MTIDEKREYCIKWCESFDLCHLDDSRRRVEIDNVIVEAKGSSSYNLYDRLDVHRCTYVVKGMSKLRTIMAFAIIKAIEEGELK